MNARERQQATGKQFVELHARPSAFLMPDKVRAALGKAIQLKQSIADAETVKVSLRAGLCGWSRVR